MMYLRELKTLIMISRIGEKSVPESKLPCFNIIFNYNLGNKVSWRSKNTQTICCIWDNSDPENKLSYFAITRI